MPMDKAKNVRELLNKETTVIEATKCKINNVIKFKINPTG